MTKVRGAAAALHTQDTGKAIQGLEVAAPYELGKTLLGSDLLLRSRLCEGKHIWQRIKASPAAIEFQKILDHPLSARYEIIGAPAYSQLGRP